MRVGSKIDPDELEECIVIKAIRDYNHSKFAQEQYIMIEGIIRDVFTGSDAAFNTQEDYGSLKDLVRQSFITEKLDYNLNMETKTYQLFEIS